MKNTEMPELVYFNLDGRAMQIRLLFLLAGVEFTDTRISRTDWPKLKKETPWGFLPILRHRDQTLFDSVAITAYVADQVGMWPERFEDRARSLALMNSVDDTFVSLQRVTRARTPVTKLWHIKSVIRNDLPALCDKFENQLKGDYFLGEQISAADLSVFSLLYVVIEKAGRFGSTAVVASYERLYAFYQRVAAIPAVASYTND